MPRDKTESRRSHSESDEGSKRLHNAPYDHGITEYLSRKVMQILGIIDESGSTWRKRRLEETIYIDSLGHIGFRSDGSSWGDWALRAKECLFGPPVYRIGKVLAANDSYSGTGWIHGDRFVITCALVVHQIQNEKQDIVFQLSSDVLIDLEVVYVCSKNSLQYSYLRDIAILKMARVQSPPNTPLASLPVGSLDAGEPLWTMKCLTAGFVKPTQKMINTGRLDSMSEKLRADFGFCGGPVLDNQEKIMGMVQGGRGGDVAIIPIDKISEIIDVVICLNPTCGLPPLHVPMQVDTITVPF